MCSPTVAGTQQAVGRGKQMDAGMVMETQRALDDDMGERWNDVVLSCFCLYAL